MKKSIIIVLSCCLLFSNCSDNQDPIEPQKIEYLWHLVKVTGGIAGIDEEFSRGTITWSFDDATKKLVVENNNDNITIEDALDSGSYDYDVLELEQELYLIIDENEFGNFKISQNLLVIDQNKMSTGDGSDGFIYSFQAETIVVE